MIIIIASFGKSASLSTILFIEMAEVTLFNHLDYLDTIATGLVFATMPSYCLILGRARRSPPYYS